MHKYKKVQAYSANCRVHIDYRVQIYLYKLYPKLSNENMSTNELTRKVVKHCVCVFKLYPRHNDIDDLLMHVCMYVRLMACSAFWTTAIKRPLSAPSISASISTLSRPHSFVVDGTGGCEVCDPQQSTSIYPQKGSSS